MLYNFTPIQKHANTDEKKPQQHVVKWTNIGFNQLSDKFQRVIFYQIKFVDFSNPSNRTFSEGCMPTFENNSRIKMLGQTSI